MPIKFRCSYCRQFLGISRAQAGGVVDCPSCGRSIRVPLLDGTIQPMADPELDLEDAHLARALDELAKLVDSPFERHVPSVSSRSESEENEAENQIPQPLLEPMPIELPLPPTPIVIQPPMNAVLADPSESLRTSGDNLLAELSSLSAGRTADDGLGERPEPTALATHKRRADLSPLMVSTVVLATFVAGMLTERFARVLENLRGVHTTVATGAKPPVVDHELTGRITYKTNEGESQPDRGARILVFPQQRTGEVKLSAVGFRPADEVPDQRVADATFKALGGAAATVDENGGFRLSIEPGTYHILVLSHFQPRGESDTDPTLDKLLSAYFDNPDELLGRVQHQFSPLRIKGTGEVWDHSF